LQKMPAQSLQSGVSLSSFGGFFDFFIYSTLYKSNTTVDFVNGGEGGAL
jgi:hypothetical protein